MQERAGVVEAVSFTVFAEGEGLRPYHTFTKILDLAMGGTLGKKDLFSEEIRTRRTCGSQTLNYQS